MPAVPRPLNPALNAPGYMAAAGAIFAAATMLYNAYNHHGVIDVQVIVAAIAAVSALLTRQVVTPVSDPKDGNGNPLVPLPLAPLVPAPAAETPAELAAEVAAATITAIAAATGMPAGTHATPPGS